MAKMIGRFLDKLKLQTDEKDTRLSQNMALLDYYTNKGKTPQKLINDLIALTTEMCSIPQAVPSCSIKPSS